MSEDIPKPTVQNPLVNSSVVPESPCIKIFDIRNLVPDGYDQKNLSPINYYIAPTSRADTFYFLVCPWGGTCIQIWDDHTCQLVGTIDPQFTSFPYQWHVTGDGNTLLVVSGSGAGQASLLVDLWDIHSSTLVRKLETGAEVSQPYVSISPDARKLAYRDNYGKVHIYNLNTDIQWSSQTLQGSHIIVGWSPTSDHLLACTLNGHAIGWRVTDSTFECVTDIQLDRSGISLGWHTDIVFSGDKIIYLNKKLGIIIRPLEDGHLQLRVRRHISSTLNIAVPRALSPDGQMLACTTPNHNCIIIATASGNIIGGLKLGKDGSLCFSNGKQLVSMSRFDDIRVWDIEAAIEQYRAANSQTEGSTSSPNEGSSTSTPVAPRNAPRARSNSSESSILNLPMADVATPSTTLSTPTPAPYTRRRQERRPIEYDSLLDISATDTPVRSHAPAAALKSPAEPQKSRSSADHPDAAPSAPDHAGRRARLTALWARIRRRRNLGPTPEQGSCAHKDKSESEPIPMRDLSDAPVLPPAPAPTDDSGIVEVAAGRLDDRLIIAPPRKKKKKKLPVSPPLQTAENAEVQPASQSNASSSSSSQTDSDAESIDWLDYICFCMCLPSKKTKKKRKGKKGRRS